jgi:hypothetical protein
MKLLMTAIVILAIASPIAAQQHQTFHTKAGDLNAYCMSNDPGDIKFCTGYITGWMDQIQIPHSMPNGDVVHNYFADGVTPEQTSRIFIKYIADHPECENKAAYVCLVGASLAAKILLIEPFTKP